MVVSADPDRGRLRSGPRRHWSSWSHPKAIDVVVEPGGIVVVAVSDVTVVVVSGGIVVVVVAGVSVTSISTVAVARTTSVKVAGSKPQMVVGEAVLTDEPRIGDVAE